jgi:hypothetical protein
MTAVEGNCTHGVPMAEECSACAAMARVVPRARTAGFRRLAAQAHDAELPLRILVSNDANTGYSDAAVARMVLACAILASIVAVNYGLAAPVLQFLPQGTPKPAPVPGYLDAWLHVVASIPDDPDAQGYHTLDGATGEPDGFISVEGIDEDGLSECLGHEIIETEGNPKVDLTVALADGTVFPRELCDAVQAQTNAQRVPIELHDGGKPVQMPNVVLLAYWNPATPAGSKVDYLGRLPGPVPALDAYGYSAVTLPDGSEQDLFGAATEELPAEKKHPESRYQAVKAALASAA